MVPLPPIKIPEPLVSHPPFYQECAPSPSVLAHHKHPTLPAIQQTLKPSIFQAWIEMPPKTPAPHRILQHHRPKHKSGLSLYPTMMQNPLNIPTFTQPIYQPIG